MIHWSFLILAFFAGAAAMYGALLCLCREYARVMKAFEDGTKNARFTGW